MKLILLFLIVSSIGGIMMLQAPQRRRVGFVAALTLFTLVGYYFLHQI
jgi:hypothetical protein